MQTSEQTVEKRGVVMEKKERILLFAQGYEDLVLYHALKDVENGFYVDVGANSPWECSVTKLFYERGWHGINIEPIEEQYQALCEDRTRDLNIFAGVGNKETELEFVVDEGCSSFDLGVIAGMEQSGRTLEYRKMRVRQLDSILEEKLPDHVRDIHFLKIDVEGFEREVLEGLSLDKYRPWVITLEAAEPGSRVPNFKEWEPILLANGYTFACDQFVNRYYVANERQELKKRFVGVEALIGKYDLYFVHRSPYRANESVPILWLIKSTILETLSRIKRKVRGFFR